MTKPDNSTIYVRASNNGASQGKLAFANQVYPCTFGRAGIRASTLEGDGVTPTGTYNILYGFFRPDRIVLPPTVLNFIKIRQNFGWCDDPHSSRYNRFTHLPFNWRHEKLWRDDHLYDICLVLDQNTRPRIQNRGSAIFFHLASEQRKPTQGCIALARAPMQKLIRRIRQPARIIISQ